MVRSTFDFNLSTTRGQAAEAKASGRRPKPVETVEPVSSWADRETGGGSRYVAASFSTGEYLIPLFGATGIAARVHRRKHPNRCVHPRF